MDEITINDWIGVIYHYLTREKFSEKELTKNLDKKITQAIEEKRVPLNKKKQVKDGVLQKFEKYQPGIYKVSKTKDNPNIKYCNPETEDSCDYINFYTNNLRERKKPAKQISFLEKHSKAIIKEIPNPEISSENYKIKGLVIGQIQSGKTANIEALVCRAVDFGYRFVIILCGRTNALRRQTQFRFDTEVLNETGLWSKLTNYGDNDFKKGSLDIDSSINKPKIAIIKKRPNVLKKLREKFQDTPELKNHPCLIIDDECDDASIDTNANKAEFDPTKTNIEIRNLIKSFNKVVYVAFSATPFANVFIDANNPDDLYPEDFIFLLETPEGYTETRDFIEKYKNNFIITTPNDSKNIQQELKKAIYSFILSCCIVKEDNIDLPKNNFSMLIHPSHKKNEHTKYEREVKEIVKVLKSHLEHPKFYPNIKTEFETLYKEDFSISNISFEKVFKHYRYFILKLEVKKLNSEKSTDEDDDQRVLKYQEKDKVYIVIGGNILARGLTLEGLLVSFFTRESKGKHQYDSLLQMQRWCGFRQDYLKYTKIYTTERLKGDLTVLCDIEKEFRKDIEEIFNEQGASPSIVMPKIKNHEKMKVVSKMKEGASFDDTYTRGDDIKTLEFFSKYDELKNNIEITKEFLTNKTNYNWITSADHIMRFVESYRFVKQALKKRVTKQIEHFKNLYPEWEIEIHNPTQEEFDDFSYSKNLIVKKVYRGLTKKGDCLKISSLKHRLNEEIDKPKLIIYTIDEKTNLKEYDKKPKKLDKSLEAPQPIVALYFQFPKQTTSSKDTYKSQ